MRRLVVVAVTLGVVCAVLALAAGCTKPEEPVTPEPEGEVAEPEGSPAETEENGEEVTEEPEPAEVEITQEMIDGLGVPIYEGAEADSCSEEDGQTTIVFTTEAEYSDVKEFYLAQIADWENNWFEMAPLGSNVAEFKSPDGTKRVTIDSGTASDPTSIEIVTGITPEEAAEEES